MAAGNVTLFSWSLVGDVPWLKRSRRGFEQSGTPKPGEALAWFEKDLAQIKAHIAQQGLKIVRTPADVDLALKGDPHVVLSVEGASFLDKDAGQLQAAYDLGIRHVQLVHYIRNPLADFQTERPEHAGMTELGKAAVQQCNRLGMLVDLAHCTSEAVDARAGSREGAARVVAQLGDAHAPARLDDAGPAGAPAQPREREGDRGQGRRGRPVVAAVGRGPLVHRLCRPHDRSSPTGSARTTPRSAPT